MRRGGGDGSACLRTYLSAFHICYCLDYRVYYYLITVLYPSSLTLINFRLRRTARPPLDSRDTALSDPRRTGAPALPLLLPPLQRLSLDPLHH